MRLRSLALAALALLAIVPAVPAAHGGCHPTTSPALITLGPGARNSITFYVAVDQPSTDDVFLPLPWIYQEMNGIDGLQRRDDWRDDTCNGAYRSDLLIF